MTSHIENQICLVVAESNKSSGNTKKTDSNFCFVFSLKSENIYISNLSQDITYGWEVPESVNNTDADNKKTSTQLSYQADKTSCDISLKGVIYSQQIITGNKQTSLAAGVKSFDQLKDYANQGVKWHIVDAEGKHHKCGEKGEWYIERIQQDNEHFISGMNALKIEFTINLKKYQ